MGDLLYSALHLFGRFVKRQSFDETVLHPERAQRAGGYLLACTHVSHVEPLIASCLFDRPIRWMARIEFFRIRSLAALLHHTNSFPVNRQGVPVSAIRKAIHLTQQGHIVGMFPEGGCRRGKDLAIRGGRIKQGICTIALRAQAPIQPLVILGTNQLNAIDPWLPGSRTKLWLNFGEIIPPPVRPQRRDWRTTRTSLAGELEKEYVRAYQELLARAKLSDAMTP
jgi:1-acyl-sn-glycerol-3-phosphate acyltransferase